MNSTEKLINLHKSLMNLRHGEGYADSAHELKVRRILRFCAEQLNVARVSVWQLKDGGDRIHCDALYVRDEQDYQHGLELKAADFPAYFEAIRQDRLINADNACKDPRTCEFADTYLKPLGISSLLDAPIFAGGYLDGVLCVEHIGEPRHWDLADMSYVAAVADTISSIHEQVLWQEARRQSEYLERCDSLTGITNRHYFQQRIEWDVHDDPHHIRVLVLMGLDGFTAINDRYGQHHANQVLKILGERFQLLMPLQNCHAGRVGGDVFGFWLPEPENMQVVESLIRSIRHILADDVVTGEGNVIAVSGSFGVFTYPYEGEGMPDPLRGAEIAMLNAKKALPGSVAYFSVRWYQQLQQKQQQENEIYQAFEHKQFCAFYQPIQAVNANNEMGLEALVRWMHPKRGILAPNQFLPLIAQLGLMKDLGDYMLRWVCEDLRYLRDLGHMKPSWVSVNLSAEHLYGTSLVADVKALLAEYRLPGSSLELEIIEEVISQNSELVLTQLHGLSELGISLSIDDFGTGYSSLSRLKFLPVRKLKVDKSFVDGLPHSADDRSITRSIIAMAKAMQLELVAEGVETTEQADWLRDEAIDYLQGYLVSKPMCLSDTENFLKRPYEDKINRPVIQ